MNKGYDPECESLAEYFLSGIHHDVVPWGPKQVLAKHIQDAIEDWLMGYEADLARDAPEAA